MIITYKIYSYKVYKREPSWRVDVFKVYWKGFACE